MLNLFRFLTEPTECVQYHTLFWYFWYQERSFNNPAIADLILAEIIEREGFEFRQSYSLFIFVFVFFQNFADFSNFNSSYDIYIYSTHTEEDIRSSKKDTRTLECIMDRPHYKALNDITSQIKTRTWNYFYSLVLTFL